MKESILQLYCVAFCCRPRKEDRISQNMIQASWSVPHRRLAASRKYWISSASNSNSTNKLFKTIRLDMRYACICDFVLSNYVYAEDYDDRNKHSCDCECLMSICLNVLLDWSSQV